MGEFAKLPIITNLVEDDRVQESYTSRIMNGIIRKYPTGDYYVTQRPAVEYGTPTENSGRGIFYESGRDTTFSLKQAVLRTGGTTVSVAASASAITDTADKVYFAVLSGDVVVLNAADNEGKWIADGTNTPYYDMDLAAGNGSGTFTTFPPNNSLTLAAGIEVLNRRAYVLTTDGDIWGSDLNDIKSWSDGLNFVRAEAEEDIGVMIAKHHNHLVYFGNKSIQYFYDAANPVGSPLSPRTDIMFNVGLVDPKTVWQIGDVIYFVGIDSSGTASVYKMEQFQIAKVSSPFIENVVRAYYGGGSMFASGVTYGGVDYYILTMGTMVAPTESYAYNSDNGTWTMWEFHTDIEDSFNVFDWTENNDGALAGITSTGYILNIIDATRDTNGVVYKAIDIDILFDCWDGDTRNWKFIHQLRYVGKYLNIQQDATIKWYDDGDGASGADGTRTLDISDRKAKLVRLGRAKDRTFQFTWPGSDEELRIEGLELYYSEGID